MEREILYRRQHIETKQLVYGDLVNTKHFSYIIEVNSLPAKSLPVSRFSEVKKETVSQFIRLDSDKKRVFEGDILDEEYEILFRKVDALGRHKAVLYNGNADTVTATLLTDSVASWTNNEFINKKLVINDNTDITITANTGTTISYVSSSETGSTLDYYIYDYNCIILSSLDLQIETFLQDSGGNIA